MFISTQKDTDSPQSKIDEIIVKKEDLDKIYSGSIQNTKQKIT